MRKMPVVLMLALLVALVATSAVSADQPVKHPFTLTGSDEMIDLCPFPVTLDAVATGTETLFFDKSGALVRAQYQLVQRDTFSANGKSLVGDQFAYSAQWLFDSSGNVTHGYTSGVSEKVPLPDGSQFIAAGRTDFAAHPGAVLIVVPDHGTATNLNGFCAALAP